MPKGSPHTTCSQVILRGVSRGLQYLLHIVLGCGRRIFQLLRFGSPKDRGNDKKNDRESNASTSPDEPSDLESQRRPSRTSNKPPEDSEDGARTNSRQSRDGQDEHLSATVSERRNDTDQAIDVAKHDLDRRHNDTARAKDLYKEIEPFLGPAYEEPLHRFVTNTAPLSVPEREQNESKIRPANSDITYLQQVPNRPFLYETDAARVFFRDKGNACSEEEVIESCSILNAHIDILLESLLLEKDQVYGSDAPVISASHPKAQGSRADDEATDGRKLAEIVWKALGGQLYEEISESRADGDAPSDEAVIEEGLYAWTAFCMHLAIKPLLFGLKLRTVEEVEEIAHQIAVHEPHELARCWNCLRKEDPPNSVDTRIQMLVEDLSPLSQPQTRDIKEYCLLEEAYRREIARGHEQQVALHWRAMLNVYEWGLDSFEAAVSQTQDILGKGILKVFAIAGYQLPPTFLDGFHGLMGKVIEDASKLAEYTKTDIFSKNIEVVIVEPGSSFDRQTMKNADDEEIEGNSGKVKCTRHLGLHAIDFVGKRKVLVLPEVVLT